MLVYLLGLGADNDTVACWHALSGRNGDIFEAWDRILNKKNFLENPSFNQNDATQT